MSQALQSTNTKFKNGGTMMVLRQGVALKSMSKTRRFHSRLILAITAFGTIGGAVLAYLRDNSTFIVPFVLMWVTYVALHHRWTQIVFLTHTKVVTQNTGKTFTTRSFEHDKDAVYVTLDGERTLMMDGLSPDEILTVMGELNRVSVLETTSSQTTSETGDDPDEVVW